MTDKERGEILMEALRKITKPAFTTSIPGIYHKPIFRNGNWCRKIAREALAKVEV